MSDRIPQVGDTWIGEDSRGNPITAKVTLVLPPLDEWSDWRISLDNKPQAHISWWWGQGWQEKETD